MARPQMRARSETELLSELNKKLDQVIALLAVQGRNPDEQIRMLYEFGYDSTFIGKVLGRDPSAVRHAKSAMTRRRPAALRPRKRSR
jgi:hypothetical protein